MGENPIPNARNPQGQMHYETYNMNNNRTYMTGSGSKTRCEQKEYAVARPWGDIITTETVMLMGQKKAIFMQRVEVLKVVMVTGFIF